MTGDAPKLTASQTMTMLSRPPETRNESSDDQSTEVTSDWCAMSRARVFHVSRLVSLLPKTFCGPSFDLSCQLGRGSGSC